MTTVFWDAKSILINNKNKGVTIIVQCYDDQAKQLKDAVKEKRRKWTKSVLLLHTIAPVHTSNVTAVHGCGLHTLKHHIYSPDLHRILIFSQNIKYAVKGKES